MDRLSGHFLEGLLERLHYSLSARASTQQPPFKIGDKMFYHAWQMIFQMAEVAVSKQLFEQVLARNRALAPGAG